MLVSLSLLRVQLQGVEADVRFPRRALNQNSSTPALFHECGFEWLAFLVVRDPFPYLLAIVEVPRAHPASILPVPLPVAVHFAGFQAAAAVD